MSQLFLLAAQLPGTSYQVADFFAKLEWWQVVVIVALIVVLKLSDSGDKGGRS